MISTFSQAAPAWIGARSSQCRTISRYPHVSIRHIPLLRPRVVRFRAECGLYVREQFVSVGINAPMCGCVLSLRMLVMGNRQRKPTGADVFGRGRDGRKLTYKLGEGARKISLPPNFLYLFKEDGGYSSTDASAFSILLLDECREIGGFLALEPGDPEGGVFVIVLQRLIKAHGVAKPRHSAAQVAGFEDPFGVLKRRLIDFFDLEHVFLHWWTCAL